MGNDGRIYGGTGYEGHLFVYDPIAGTITDKGPVVAGECSVRSLTTGHDGKIWGGTGQSDGSGRLFIYDPATDCFTDLGWAMRGDEYVFSLTIGADGKIYGGTDGHLFAYDPTSHPYQSPGTATSVEVIPAITDIGQVAGRWYSIASLTAGTDGKIYAESYGHLFVYDPVGGVITDKGQAVPGEFAICSLTTGADGKIYGGTEGHGHFFVYDPASGVITDKGQAVPGESGVSSLTTGSDGKIYGGTGWEKGRLFVYDPRTDGVIVFGQAIAGDSCISSLTTGSDGKIYGGTLDQTHLFVYDPAYTFAWSNVTFTKSTPPGTSLTVDILSADDNILLSNISSGCSLASISSTTYPSLKLRASLSTTDGAKTPVLSDWVVSIAYALFGDFNRDGVVDVADIQQVASRWRMTDEDPHWDPRYDLDDNGIITIVDIMLVVAVWGSTCP